MTPPRPAAPATSRLNNGWAVETHGWLQDDETIERAWTVARVAMFDWSDSQRLAIRWSDSRAKVAVKCRKIAWRFHWYSRKYYWLVPEHQVRQARRLVWRLWWNTGKICTPEQIAAAKSYARLQRRYARAQRRSA